MKKKNKLINILLGSMLPTTIIPSATAIGIISNKPFRKNGFYYNNEYFENILEFENYIRDQVLYKYDYERKKIYYAMNTNKMFETDLSLNKYLYKNIISSDITLTRDSKLYENNLNFPLTFSELNEIDFNNLDKNIRIYLGKNNVAYSSEREAKLSFFNYNKFYKFNNKYYENKEKIINELILKYNEVNNQHENDENKLKDLQKAYNLINTDFIRYNAPNGLTSNINFNDNGMIQNDLLKKFIENNAKRYIKSNNKIYEVHNFAENFNALEWKNSSIIKVKSTKGNKKFLVDVDKDEPSNFYGDYILTSPCDDIKDFKQYSKWFKHKRNENIIDYKDSIYKDIVNKFVSNLMTNVSNYELDKKIQTIKNSVEQKKLYEQFHNNFSVLNFFPLKEKADILKKELKNSLIFEQESSNLLEKIENIIKFMKKGKRGTFFNQLNIIYFSGLAYLAKYNAKNRTIFLFKNYFKELINNINNYLEDVLGDFYFDNEGKKIDLEKKYNLNDYSLDIDTNNDFFISYLTDNSNIVNAISTIYAANISAINSSSFLPFENSILIKKDNLNDEKIQKFVKLYDKYALRSFDTSNYIFDENIGEYKTNITNNTLDKVASNALQYYTYLSAESMNNYIRNDFIEKLKNIDYSGINYDWQMIVKFESSFDFYKKSLLKYIKNGNNKLSPQQISILKFENKNDKNKLAKMLKDIDKKHFNKFINTKELTKNELKIDALMNNLNKEQYIKKINNAVQTAGGVLQTAASITQLYFAVQSNDINRTLNIVKSVQGIVEGALNMFSMFPIVSIISNITNIMFSIITEIIGTKIQYDYVYSQTGNPKVQYIWDGGVTTSKFWGLSTFDNSTIKDAKLLEPIQFMPSFDTDYYYYNNKKYRDHQTKLLERKLIRDILENNENEDFIKSNDFQFVYSFEPTEKGSDSLYFNNVEELSNELVNNPEILNKYKSSAGNFKILEKDHQISSAIDLYEKLKHAIYYDLKPIVVMQIPKFYNRKKFDEYTGYLSNESLAKLIDLIHELNEKPELLESEYLLLLDGNLIDKTKLEKPYLYNVDDLNSLKELFIAKFEVFSKLASENMFKVNNNYNDLKEVIKGKIYSIFNNNNQLIYFLSYDAALKHLNQIQYLNIIEKNIQDKINRKYIYKNLEFLSIEKIIEYCKNFFISVDEYKKTRGGNND